jgi:PRC-barrel domain
MTTQGTVGWAQWKGFKVHDRDGQTIGSIDEIYADEATGQPSWFAIRTGLFGINQTFVPIQGSTTADDHVVVAFDKSQIKDAPNINPEGHLNHDEERRLWEHYGMTYQPWSGTPQAHHATTGGTTTYRLRLRRFGSFARGQEQTPEYTAEKMREGSFAEGQEAFADQPVTDGSRTAGGNVVNAAAPRTLDTSA